MRTSSSREASAHSPARLAHEVVDGATAFAARARSERAAHLTTTETAVLGWLVRRDGMTAGEVARWLRMGKQSLTRTFASLEAKGLVRRLRDPADGRHSILSMTAAGREALDEEMAPRRRWAAAAIEQELGEPERRVLAQAARILTRLAESRPGPPAEER